MPSLRPRAPLSYRRLEHEAGSDVDAYSERHWAWVARFAANLRAHGDDVFLDQDLRDIFATRKARSP
jgi:hypothetical protein